MGYTDKGHRVYKNRDHYTVGVSFFVSKPLKCCERDGQTKTETDRELKKQREREREEKQKEEVN